MINFPIRCYDNSAILKYNREANFLVYIGNNCPVGSCAHNGYGLYDMASNVLKWCADWWDGNYYKYSPYNNPKGPDSGTFKIVRGGAFYFDAYFLRVACRMGQVPNYTRINGGTLGFRLAKD